MVTAIAAAIIAAVSTAVVFRIRECHVKVNALFSEVFPAAESSSADVKQIAGLQFFEPLSGRTTEAAFTKSLLALSKVGLRAPDGSPEPSHDESSSLVLVHPAQSKNLAPRL